MELPGTQGALGPFFSPDGQWIGFWTADKLNKVSVEGGAVVPLAAEITEFAGASWGEDGNIVVASALKGLLRVPAAGGPPEMMVALANGESALSSPQILPGGKAVLFSVTSGTPPTNVNSIQVMTLADRQRKTVVRSGTSSRYLAMPSRASYLAYTNQATLFAIPFDPDRLETRGTAVPILDDVAYDNFRGNLPELDFSRTGTLVYRRGAIDAGFIVAWIEGAGKTEPLLTKPGSYLHPIFSPDGQSLALIVDRDIWRYEWRRDTMTRLTFTGGINTQLWSPDGRYIVFSGPGGLFRRSAPTARASRSL